MRKPNPKSAQRLIENYQAESKEKLEEMVRDMDNAPDPEQLENFTLLYLFDMSYPRADIAMAEKYTRLEKGWP